MDKIKTYGFLICLFFTVFMSAQADCRAQGVYTSAQGILGPFDPRRSAELSRDIIAQRTNLYSDMIPLYPSRHNLEMAYRDASIIKEGDVSQYYAVYHIFPESGSPIVMYGLLMPATEDLAGVHLASMHFKPNEKTLAKIKALPAATLVYGVDAGGNVAWWPLEFFAGDTEYPGYYSAVGLYAYTYRPSPKLAGRYGNLSFYLDIINPASLYPADVIPEENLTIFTDNLPDEAVKAVQYSKSAFFSKIIPLLGLYPEYANIPYEIAFLKPEGKTGSIELRIPAGLPHHHRGDSISIAPAPGMFEALETYMVSVLGDLYAAGKSDAVKKLLGYEIAVSHFNEAGEVDILKVPDQTGRLGFCPEIYIRPNGDEAFLHVHDFDRNMSKEGIYVFVRYPDDPASVELFSLLEAHLAMPCYGGWPPVNEPVAVDWTQKYDTELHGIKKITQSPPYIRDDDEQPYVAPDRLFLLDMLPGFFGRDIEGFGRWVMKEMGYRPYTGATDAPGLITMEFIVGTDGKMRNIEIVEYSNIVKLGELIKVLSREELRWSPGEISGFPVNVKLRVTLEFGM